MSTIDPNTIDPTKPAEGFPLTANVRANEQATQDNFAAAKADIEALETRDAVPGHIIQDEGASLPTQRGLLNFVGTGVSLADNATNSSTDVSISFIDALNVGIAAGSAGVFRDKTAGDPAILNFRSLVSADASVIFTEGADTIDLQATGAGGGQANTQTNIGGAIELGAPQNGVDLPIRTLNASQFELVGDVARIIPSLYADQTTTDQHISNTGIHFAVSSLVGAGLVNVTANALDVGAGAGITVTATNVAVTGAPTTKGDLWSYTTGPARLGVGANGEVLTANSAAASGLEWTVPAGGGDVTSAVNTVDGEVQLGAATAKGIKGLTRQAVGLPLISGGTGAGVGPSWSQIITSGIADAAVTFEKLETFGAETLLLRGLGAGPPSDTKISGLANHAPAPTDYLLLETAAGLLRHSLVSALPGGGDVSSPGGTTVDAVQLGAAGATDIKDGPAISIIWQPPVAPALTGTWNPAPAITDEVAYYSNDATPLSVGTPTGDGAWEFLCGPACEPSVDGSWTELGTRAAGTTQMAYLREDGVNSQRTFTWGAST